MLINIKSDTRKMVINNVFKLLKTFFEYSLSSYGKDLLWHSCVLRTLYTSIYLFNFLVKVVNINFDIRISTKKYQEGIGIILDKFTTHRASKVIEYIRTIELSFTTSSHAYRNWHRSSFIFKNEDNVDQKYMDRILDLKSYVFLIEFLHCSSYRQ